MKTTIRNSAFLGFALFALLSIATVSRANDEKKTKDGDTIEFKYVGKKENQSIFQLQMNIQKGEEYLIRFRDHQGYVLYTDVVKNDFTQKYAIDTEEVDNTVTVEIKSLKTKKSEIFTIRRNQTLLDETVVAKVF
jgi:hydrogenase maturation factor HypE